jgi:hypothetical protein
VTPTPRSSFDSRAAGHTREVEAAALDDTGRQSDFGLAGVLTVFVR